MPYHFKKKQPPSGPDRYYHGNIRDVRTGVAAGGRRWWLYVVRPDYYWVEGNVIRDAPLIKWFSKVDLWKKIGEQVFLSGKFKEPSSIPPTADMLANVVIMDEASFKSKTGYPEGKMEGGGPPPAPAPSPLPPPPGKETPPGGMQQPAPIPPPPAAKPCVKKVDDLIAKLESTSKAISKAIKEGSDKAFAELEKVMPGGSKVLKEGHLPRNVISRAEEAIRVLESPTPDENAMRFIEQNLPEVRAEAEAPISPRDFLDMAKALMDHALAAIDLAADDPDSVEKMDMGDVHATVGEGAKTVTLHPMFGPEDLSRGIDHIESVFLSPLQAEVSRAERETAQGIPEFQHDLPFIPKTLGKRVNRTEMTSVAKRELERLKAELDKAGKAMMSLPMFADLEEMSRTYQQDIKRLDLMKWDCPSESSRITEWKNGHVSTLANLLVAPTPSARQFWRDASSWVGRNCKFASR